MEFDLTGFIKNTVKDLEEPDNLFQGQMLPPDFQLPDSILLFYHDFCAAAPNSHNRYTLVFPLTGMHYYVDHQEFDLEPGDLLFVPPYSLRFLSPQSEGYQRFFITFQLRKTQSYLPEKFLNRISADAAETLKQLFEFSKAGDALNLSLKLFEFLTRLAPADRNVQHSSMSPEIAGSVAFINEHLHSVLDNAVIAAKVNMSVSNLRRRFLCEMGMPIHRYISSQRLEYARYYLQRTYMRVEDIASRCGFLSASSFSHFFIANVGISPLNYRKKFKAQIEASS